MVGTSRVAKALKKLDLLFSTMEVDFIYFKSIFSFTAIAENVWGFLLQMF